ncbi:MAG: beta-Ala-His dipeptidase [Clostridia bacterium]|nr:beta-Ala-His dipeptidase [Clostridia bacterium]
MSMTEYLSQRPARFFEELSAIPRASGNEAGVADYLMCFAKERGLDAYRDAANNVLIRKAGSVGREAEPALLLQAHTDMVAEAAFGTQHDFAKEGIVLCQEGNVLSAKGTTLGADDGFGVALLLSALDSASPSHPPLECLFTSSEEIGLIGAGAFDYSRISARRMLNFDSDEENLVVTGCCGGMRHDLTLPVVRVPGEGQGLEISLYGLCGGHSGGDIHKGRANALVTMGKLLKGLADETPFALVSLHGGDKDNAIPRDCTAVIRPECVEKAQAYLAAADRLLALWAPSDEDGERCISQKPVAIQNHMDADSTHRALEVLSVRNGVFAWQVEGIAPRTSRNLASVRTDDAALHFCLSSRSPLAGEIDASAAELDKLAGDLGGNIRHHSRYPGWDGAADSPVSGLWQSVYRAVTGGDIRATTIHAGLECGLISAALPGLDVISVGCNIFDLHTPAERMELDSFERIYRTLIAFLQKC